MGSLKNCLKHHPIPPDEAESLWAQVEEIQKDEGLKGRDAAIKAVEEAIGKINTELGELLSKVTLPQAQTPGVPLPYGQIILDTDVSPVIPADAAATPEAAEKYLRAYLALPKVAVGTADGARGTTRIGLLLQGPDGRVILAGLPRPQTLLSLAGNKLPNSVAVTRMATGKKKKVIDVGGTSPALVRDVVAAGFKPVLIVHFRGEPSAIFQVFPSMAAFDAAFAATPKTSAPQTQDVVSPPLHPAEVAKYLNALHATADVLGPEYTKEVAAKGPRVNEMKAVIKRLYEVVDALDSGRTDSDTMAEARAVLTEAQAFAKPGELPRFQTENFAADLDAFPEVPQTDPSRAAIEADRTIEFLTVADRMRRNGVNVEVFSQEFFRQGTAAEIQRQIALLQQQLSMAVTDKMRADIEEQIALRQQALADLPRARGATFTPWHIGIAVADVEHRTMSNLVTLIHEAVESLTMGMTPMMQGAVTEAVHASLAEIRAQTAAASARTGVAPAEVKNDIDALAESLAQKLAAEGVPEAPSLARAIWQWVKNLYYRAAMALQRGLGAEPDPKLALDWFENQLRRVVGGDFDYRLASLLDRFVPQPRHEEIRRFRGIGGTPGGMTDYYDTYAAGITQPGVLPNSREAVRWNIEFQTTPKQVLKGQEIPGPEARAREQAAALRQYVARLERIRTESGSTDPWNIWWTSVSKEEDPKVVLADLEGRDPNLATAEIGGQRMTSYMNGEAALKYRKLLEDFQSHARGKLATSTEQLTESADRQVLASREYNRVEGDRRNAHLHEGILKEKLKAMVATLVRNTRKGYSLAEEKGELAEAIRNAEGLLRSDPIPDEYQDLLRQIYDGQVQIFAQVRAIAKLDLPIPEMTVPEIITAIEAAPDSELQALARNKPLMVALATLAKRNSDQIDEIALGALNDAGQYHAIHDELEAIRKASDPQIREMLSNFKEQLKGATLRERMKRNYLSRRGKLARARVATQVAQARKDTLESAMPHIDAAVEEAQQSGSTRPTEWFVADGAEYTAMEPLADGTWKSHKRTLHVRNNGQFENSAEIRSDIVANHRWLQENASRAGGEAYERIKRQTQELKNIDFQQEYREAHGYKMATFMAPLTDEARLLGPGGERLAQMLQFFESIRFTNREEMNAISGKAADAWNRAQKAAGIDDIGQFQQQVWDQVAYYLNTEPGLDEDVAIRHALRMAHLRLSKAPSSQFDAAFESLLRFTKEGMEKLVSVAEKNGAFVKDDTLKSEFRRAVARGWLTSLRSFDHGLVMRITDDMQKAGWELSMETEYREGGRKRQRVVGATTFANLSENDAANDDELAKLLQQLFTPGIVHDWLEPFINKGGIEVFKDLDGEAIPQLVLQNAWAQANGDVLAWMDAVGETVGLPLPEEQEDGSVNDPKAEFRLAMLNRMDFLFGQEAKMAYEAVQTRDMYDPYGPKPHVIMDARHDEFIPPEHLDFIKFDRVNAQMLLSEIAYHAAFGRNGSKLIATINEMKNRADKGAREYDGLKATTKGGRMAEAAARGLDYEDLKRKAKLSKQIAKFQPKLEAFTGANTPGGIFDDSRIGLTFLNFLTGQTVDTPKVSLYNMLNLGQGPMTQRSLNFRALKTASDGFVETAKTGLGSILEGLNLHLYHASDDKRWVAETLGASRNLPWSIATADVGAGGRQAPADRILVKPLHFIRNVQRRGVGLPFQAEAREFPRLAIVPGLGVSNSFGQISAVSGAKSFQNQLEGMLRHGVEFFATHRDEMNDPTFRFHAQDLGLGRSAQGIFDWWRFRGVEFGLGTLEDLVRSVIPAAQAGKPLLTKDIVLKIAQMTGAEVNGDVSVATTPSIMITHPFMRFFFPLLRWPFWAVHKTYENMANPDGQRDYKTTMRGIAILAMWNLPMALAFTFLLDYYDDKLLGKKSNLPPTGKAAAIPFVGPFTEAITADRSIPQTLKGYVVRGARAGNMGGMFADFVGQLLAPMDSASGRRAFDMNQRVFVMSQLLNAQQAVTNVINQNWTTTWASFWSPMMRSIGGNGAMHVLDLTNNALGLDNAEARQVMRINASNWLRAAASENSMELRSGGTGTPTPMSVWTREMFTAAMANDTIGFREAYRNALDAARKTVSSDPTIMPEDREREAERRVLAGWRGRNPLSIFARHPTDMEVRRMLNTMADDGAQDVRNALARFARFTQLIAVTPQEAQQRARLHRLTHPALPRNPFRLPMASGY